MSDATIHLEIEKLAKALWEDDVRHEGWTYYPWGDLDPDDRKRYRAQAWALYVENANQFAHGTYQ